MNTIEQTQARIEKLSLAPGDIIICRTLEDMQTLVEMTEHGIGFTVHGNPVLFIPGGLEKATKADLENALRFIEKGKEFARIIPAFK